MQIQIYTHCDHLENKIFLLMKDRTNKNMIGDLDNKCVLERSLNFHRKPHLYLASYVIFLNHSDMNGENI